MHRTMRNIALSPFVMALSASLGMMQAAHAHDGAEVSLGIGSYNNRAHGWAGKRRKLKKSHQDHQRPRRRRI